MLQTTPRDAPSARLEAQDGFATLLSCRTLSFPTTCPGFDPGAPPLDVKIALRWTSPLDVKPGEITVYRIQRWGQEIGLPSLYLARLRLRPTQHVREHGGRFDH